MKESPPALRSVGPRRRYHQTDRDPARGEARRFHVKASRHGVLRRGPGRSSGGRQSPHGALALPSPHPLAVGSAQDPPARRFSSELPAVCGTEACAIVAMTPRPARRCGGGGLCPPPASPATRPVATCATRPRSREPVNGYQRRLRPESRSSSARPCGHTTANRPRRTMHRGRHPDKALSAGLVRSAPPGNHCDG